MRTMIGRPNCFEAAQGGFDGWGGIEGNSFGESSCDDLYPVGAAVDERGWLGRRQTTRYRRSENAEA